MRKTYLLYSFVAIAVTFLVRDHIFFWDTVQLASKHAHFYYDTGFSSLLLPLELDSGHPPAFGIYLALCWEWIGKTLTVSHFSILPFLLGIGYFLLKIAAHLTNEQQAYWLLLLCFADPVLASQSILVSPDLPLVCFLLMALYAILSNRSEWLLMLAIVGLGLTSMRGMMVAVGLFLFSLPRLGSDRTLSLSLFVRKISPFIPGGLVGLAFFIYHYQQTGWIGYHPESTWAPSFERVDLNGFVKNIAVFGWRMLDFGRIAVCLALLYFAPTFFQKDFRRSHPKTLRLLMLVVLLFLFTIPTQLLYKGLLAHRYFLPLFLSLHLLLFYQLFGSEQQKGLFSLPKKWLTIGVTAVLLLGNTWVYPKKISQGWDSTLAHLPWYQLIEDGKVFLESQEIEWAQVGTAFPNIGPRKWYSFDRRERGFKEKEIAVDCYILYSNIMNDFTDEEIDILEAEWDIVYQKEKRGVCLIIYKNTDVCEN